MRSRSAHHGLAILVAGLLALSLAGAAQAGRTWLGTLTGSIVLEGGAPPIPGHPRAPLAGTVTVYTRAGRVVRRAYVRAGRHFDLRLPPGRYLANTGSELHPRFPYGCPPVAARVDSGATVRIVVGVGCGVP